MHIPQKTVSIFQNKILEWYDLHRRDLPWRKTRDPYRILVSEIMLQQTQVNRVIPKFEAWLKKFPTVKQLAEAKVSEVLEMWSGLGYNRRALNLKKTAIIVSEKYKGKFPRDEKALLELPGIGSYTARAVLCFAFNEQVTVIDTNVRKVILTQVHVSEKDVPEIAAQLLPIGKAYEWNQALMDYSSAVLKKEKIDIPKQSKFHGSKRYYRGQVLKQLLNKKQIALKELGSLIKKDFVSTEKTWLTTLVMELRDEGFVELEKDTVKISN